MNLWPLILTLGLIFLAELGDKTQLLAFGFASKYPAAIVLGAVSAATAVLMGLAVIFGGAISLYIPALYIKLFAGVVFIAFGLWTLFEKEGKDGVGTAKGNPFFIIFSAFFMAELGDKTQLAAFALSAEYGAPVQVWVGATLGMVAANFLAVLASSWVKKFIPEKTIKWIGALVFILFGIAALIGVWAGE